MYVPEKGLGVMRLLQILCVLVVLTAGALCQLLVADKMHSATSHAATEAKAEGEPPSSPAPAAPSDENFSAVFLQSRLKFALAGGFEVSSSDDLMRSEAMLAQPAGSGTFAPFALSPDSLPRFEPQLPPQRTAAIETDDEPKAAIPSDALGQPDNQPDNSSQSDNPPPRKGQFDYLVYDVYSELPPDPKPGDVVLAAFKNVPVGTPLQEIKRAADAFGIDFNFMKAVAKIESDFNPKERTGSYIGLFQLSRYEFRVSCSGDITSPRDNAVAAAYKFATDAALFRDATDKTPTFSDLYLIHQQGWQGAAEHVAHPGWVAWKSMCATDEGKEKGERWCKRAIWLNTLPAVKRAWKTVEKLTSGAFVSMWRQRVDSLYGRYADAAN
jgi:hypothetical protein